MGWLKAVEEWLMATSTGVPVEAYAFYGSFIEEVVAPIPSPLVMATAGSLAFAQRLGVPFLLWIALIGAVGKALGAWLIYFAAERLEAVVVGRFGRFLGVSRDDIEKLRGHFRGGWKDAALLTLLRALPVMPSSPVSVACGVLKLDLRVYLAATLAGTWFRNLFYLYVGYSGLEILDSWMRGAGRAESLVQILLLAALGALGLWLLWMRRKSDPVDALKKKLSK